MSIREEEARGAAGGFGKPTGQTLHPSINLAMREGGVDREQWKVLIGSSGMRC